MENDYSISLDSCGDLSVCVHVHARVCVCLCVYVRVFCHVSSPLPPFGDSYISKASLQVSSFNCTGNIYNHVVKLQIGANLTLGCIIIIFFFLT